MSSSIDLHLHSSFSDGELKPNEILRLANSKNIDTISITDHDTLLGNQELFNNPREEATKHIKVIPGVELSAKANAGRMHILGYGIDVNNPDLNKKMIEIQNNSIYSVLALIHQIKKDYGIVFPTRDIINLVASNTNVGRPDLAKLIVEYGKAADIQNAFDQYLHAAYNKTRSSGKGLEYEECIDLILKAGGIPVLAHPNTLDLNNKDLLILIKRMIKDGLMGIEVFHSEHSQAETLHYMELANRLDLLSSGGSDYHGPIIKPKIELGSGINNNLHIEDLSILKRL